MVRIHPSRTTIMAKHIFRISDFGLVRRKTVETGDPAYYQRIGRTKFDTTIVLIDDVIDWCLSNLGYRPDLIPIEYELNKCQWVGPHVILLSDSDALLFKMTWL